MNNISQVQAQQKITLVCKDGKLTAEHELGTIKLFDTTPMLTEQLVTIAECLKRDTLTVEMIADLNSADTIMYWLRVAEAGEPSEECDY
jgi:hypothetical protein